MTQQRSRGRVERCIHGIAMAVCALCPACSRSAGDRPESWSGSIDTLPSGQVVVRNTSTPLWAPGSEWRIDEDLRIGNVDGEGPDTFGQIMSLLVDSAGRIWILDAQTQRIEVFAPSGTHERTVGRKGGGPGEFAQAMRLDLAPNGHIWVMDPRNTRLSVFDSVGTYLEARRALGGLYMSEWPGGFDTGGSYYAPVSRHDVGFGIGLVRYDSQFAPQDTLWPPSDPVDRATFRFVSPDGGMQLTAGVPYQGGLKWQLSPAGAFWALVTDQYRLFELNARGDTLRSITKEFATLPVTDADREAAREQLKWFTSQGGRIDLSKLPRSKPSVADFFLDDERNIWVKQVSDDPNGTARYDVFDAAGRFLGTVAMPFTPALRPIVRKRNLYTVTTDSLDVQYVVRARIITGS